MIIQQGVKIEKLYIVVPKFKTNTGLRMFHVRAFHLWSYLLFDIGMNFDPMSINQFKNSALFQC